MWCVLNKNYCLEQVQTYCFFFVVDNDDTNLFDKLLSVDFYFEQCMKIILENHWWVLGKLWYKKMWWNSNKITTYQSF